MLQGPSPGRRTKRKKPQNGRARAQTDGVKPAAYYNTTDQKAQTQAQDDFLDFLGLSKPQGSANKADDTDNKDNGDNPFGDVNDNPFEDDFASPSPSGASTNSQFASASPSGGDDEKSENTLSKPKKRTPKKKKKKGRARAQTAAAAGTLSSTALKKPEANGTTPPAKSAVKMKKIDVLPLLHQGIRSNKFKLNGSKSKVRTFYLTENNFYFCWEAVSNAQTTEKKSGGGLFGKGKGGSRTKIDKDRSIPIRSIRNIQKNPAYMMQSYAFIPPQSKAFTLTINYTASGQDKKLNFMAYEHFHHSLFYEGLQQLIEAAHDPKRNLSEVFELYVDFPKEILPKHLRPQRFKWEPLADGDFAQQKGQTEAESAENGSNMYFDTSPNSLKNLEVFDPTSNGGVRGRVKSF